MPWFLSDSLPEYAATAGGLLSGRPAEHTILLGAMETLRAAGAAAYGPHAPLFGWWQGPGGEVSAAFVHTPPFPLALTSVPGPDAAAALAQVLAARGRAVDGVNAGPEGAEVFARGWYEVTGDAVECQMRNRLFRLGELRWPAPRPGGGDAPRPAGVHGRADPDVGRPGAGRPGVHPAGPAGEELRGRRDRHR